jgi:Calcineurin-like phosphoesterase
MGCSVCGCCRTEPYDDPLSPYLYGDTPPIYDGSVEVGQQAPAPGGTGSAVIPIDPGSWTLVLMPDTQHYSESYPAHFTAQTQWIKNNAAALNIKYVLHEGDIVNVPNSSPQWVNARTSLDVLNGAVPYALAAGNHDYGISGSARTTLFDNGVAGQNYFGVGTPYAAQTSIGGFYQGDGLHKTDNSWHTFNANGQDWIVVALEYGPRNQVVQWADQVIADHPNHNAILVTHAYMYFDDTIYDWVTKGSSQSWSPHYSGFQNLPGATNDGQELWDKTVKKHENFKFVFNGHVLSDGAGKRATYGDNGNVVHQILANYQMNAQGGQGDMRLLEFKADGETVVVRTYSPVLDRYNTNADQSFSLNMNTTDYAAFTPPPIGHAVVANLIASGATDPAGNANTVDSVTVPHFSAPGVGTGQLNRGDYQVTIDGGNVSYTRGIMLASISQHERSDFGANRASVDIGRSSFGDGNLALSIMQVGQNNKEVNFNTSVAWFPFDTGFRGAHVNANGTLPTSAFNGVAQSMVTRNNTGRYTVNLGVNSQMDGMLFVTGNTNDNTVVQTGPASNGANWDVRVTENNSNFAATGVDRDWSFLYLSYQTPGLIGGYYDGSANSHIASVGAFTMAKTAAGQYELTVTGESPTTGMLILTVANEVTSGTPSVTAPDDNVLTYATGANGKFTINSYDLPGAGFQDTKFVWAFISFDNPLEPYVLPGDYNRDALVDNFDYQTWRSQFGRTTGWRSADGNGDGVVDSADFVIWRNAFGGSGSGAASAVPEPHSLVAVFSAMLWGLSSVRLRSRRVRSYLV